jgi:hypothetical protein
MRTAVLELALQYIMFRLLRFVVTGMDRALFATEQMRLNKGRPLYCFNSVGPNMDS